jgi:hypothetical protein
MIWSRCVFSLMFSFMDHQWTRLVSAYSESLVHRPIRGSRRCLREAYEHRPASRERRPRAAYFSSRVLFLPRIPTTPLLSTISPAQLYNTSAGSHTHRTHHAGPFDF